MDFKNIPLLLTSAINPVANHTTLQNQDERINATIKSIKNWHKIGIKKIILCDGTGFDLEKKLTNSIDLKNRDFKLELISFKNDFKSVKKYGKGFGEGEIIKKAFEVSELLKTSDFFMKCTSKLWVENFEEISKYFNGIFLSDVQGYFRPKMLDTRFYISSKAFFLDNLIYVYKNVNDDESKFLEHCYLNTLKKKKILHWISKVSIDIRGLSGTSGKFQKRKFYKQKIRSIRNRIFFNFVK